MLQAEMSDTGKVIELTDESIEHSKVLREFLQLICTNEFTGFSASDFDAALNVITLSQKYDCAGALRVMSLLVEAPDTAKLGEYHRFFYACALDQVDAVNRLFLKASATSWPKQTTGLAELSVHASLDGPGLDLTVMGSVWVDRLARKYFLALLRASRLRIYPRNEPWTVIAEEFKKQLQLQGQSFETYASQLISS